MTLPPHDPDPDGRPARISGAVEVVASIAATWNLDARDTARLFNLESHEPAYVRRRLETPGRPRDALYRRIALTLQIRSWLAGLFRDPRTENAWLRERHIPLRDRTPLELLLSRSNDDLQTVCEYVRWVCRR